MEVESIKVGDYLKRGSFHLFVLLAWAIAGFVFSFFNPIVSLALGLIAPIPMIVMFGHLGGKFKYPWQAVFAGILIGFITGAVAGLMMSSEAVWQLYLPAVGSKIMTVLSYGSLIAVTRAIFGGFFAWVGWMLFRGKFR